MSYLQVYQTGTSILLFSSINNNNRHVQVNRLYRAFIPPPLPSQQQIKNRHKNKN